MTASKRKKIFRSLVTAFVLIGAAVALYANGWRFDISTFKVEKVGAIFIRSFPDDARISLNGSPVANQSGLFGKGTLVNDLLPKNYVVRLESDDFEPWEENAVVEPSLVTELGTAVLVPKTATAVATSSPKNFWVVGDNLVTQDKNAFLKIGEERIGKGEVAGWTNDGGAVLVENQAARSYALVDVKKKSAISVNDVLKKAGFIGAGFTAALDPWDGSKVTIVSDGKTLGLDVSKTDLTVIDASRNVCGRVALSQFLAAWAECNPKSGTSTIIVFDKFLKKTLARSESVPGILIDLEWTGAKQLAAVDESGTLYRYDEGNNVMKKMATGVKKISVSSGGSELAAIEENSLEIFSADGDAGYHRFNLPQMQSVVDAAWYGDASHLFVSYPDRVVFLDLKDASLKNLIVVSEGVEKWRYDEKSNGFYALKNNTIGKIGFPQ